MGLYLGVGRIPHSLVNVCGFLHLPDHCTLGKKIIISSVGWPCLNLDLLYLDLGLSLVNLHIGLYLKVCWAIQ
jgi:hypothetical protein